ncbi:MAG: hypothetical protein P4L71_03380 [Acetobacteraceae bacterium]|nr:hypothetical protein [Acetobacteraceae bacterium]
MDVQVGVAVIALVASIASAGVSWWGNRRIEGFKAEQDRQNLLLQDTITRAQAAEKARQDEESAEQAALRAYRFEALKRLYTQVQPLMFQMRGALQQARDHAVNLARASRNGNLGAGSESWMRDAEYYLPATMYRFMLPAAYQRLMEEHLALVDLSLDPTTALVYALLGEYARAWRSDYDIAPTFYGTGGYAPVEATAEEPHPVPNAPDGRDARQGLYAGWRDTMVDHLIVEGETPRLLRFGAFVNALQRSRGPMLNAFGPLAEQLQVFEPATRPVQWAILLALGSLAELTDWALAEGPLADPTARWAALARDPEYWKALSFQADPAAERVVAVQKCVIAFVDGALRHAMAVARPLRTQPA